ncbi:hypothetical protein KSD_39180 [Ktedonobacter sp. SOSP1-85]|uniref:hypothetical protein n=1 Tax=Ktedonobacter sp. SOSP1-85 TaxID=2778367 RepID=UPI00191599F5|nr:hypothetical protein [Ktedonobacter sp. SOSP1-85]GHO76147.1 hypothetical protein KSD_39180 [Ktedonobacter sp. SOSP1-85]
MKRDIPCVLTVIRRGLEEKELEKKPIEDVFSAANGDLHFLIHALAEAYLSEEEQQQIETVLDHHSDCVYTALARITCRWPLSERAFLERPLE